VSRRVVIVGGGIVGSAIAAGLSTHEGAEVTVLDRGAGHELLGSTGHAPGFVAMLSESTALTALAIASAQLYEELGPGRAGFDRMGGLEVARTERSLRNLERRARLAAERGVKALVVGPDEAAEAAPVFVDRETCLGGVLYPEDGAARADILTSALRDQAARSGARFCFGAGVSAIDTRGDRVMGVRISTGARFDADDVVIAGGIWGPQIAGLVGEKLPLTPVAHPYVYGPRRASPPPKRLPIVRWREETAYARDHGDRYGIGTHDHTALAVNAASISHAEQPWQEAVFGPAIDAALRLMPREHRFAIDQRLNGVFAMPADNLPYLGPSAGIAGLWIAVSIWVTHAGGAAGVLVDMMAGRTPSVQGLETLRPERFAGQNDEELTARALKKYREIWMPMSPPQVAQTKA